MTASGEPFIKIKRNGLRERLIIHKLMLCASYSKVDQAMSAILGTPEILSSLIIYRPSYLIGLHSTYVLLVVLLVVLPVGF